jgi:predicted membrane protein
MFRIIKAFFAFILLSVICVALLFSLLAVAVVRHTGVHPASIIRRIVEANRDHVAMETVDKRFKADKVESLKVLGASGDITVQPAENGSNEIHIVARRVISGMGNVSEFRKHFADIITSAHLDGSTLVVESQATDALQNAGLSYSVSYEITAPARLTLALESQSGTMTANGFHGGSFQSESGDIKLSSMEGDVKAQAQSGEVKIDGANVPASLEIATQSGDTEISGIRATGSALGVHVKSGSGAVSYSGDAGELSVETSSGEVKTHLTGGVPLRTASIQAQSGEVQLILPHASNASIRAYSQSGDVQVDGNDKTDNGTTMGHDVTAKLGDGMARVNVKTQSGSIEVRGD